MAGRGSVAVEALEEQGHGGGADSPRILMDRRETDPCQSRQPGVVVADDRNIVRHPQSSVVKSLEKADCREVIGGEHRGGHDLPVEDVAGDVQGGLLGVVAFYHDRPKPDSLS